MQKHKNKKQIDDEEEENEIEKEDNRQEEDVEYHPVDLLQEYGLNSTDIKKLQVGEIIAFKKEGKIITHRIINIQKLDSTYVIQTKGDANNAPDSFQVKEDEVLGVVKYSIKYLGYPTIWFNDLYTGKETS